jgi:DNA-damage-inducible protein D
MSDLVHNADSAGLSFEDFKQENGISYWWATDLMRMLGYPNMKSFQKVLDRATKAFVSLNIPHYRPHDDLNGKTPMMLKYGQHPNTQTKQC